MSRPSEVREPFYFGREGRRLYGCLHAPPRPRPGAPGILLCPPLGQESMRSHRAFVQLAVRLSREGFPVLRFDYFGCGDSEGVLLDVDLEGLGADVELAAAELVRRGRVAEIACIGLRAGVAAIFAAAELRPTALALWDPLVDGRTYLAELDENHRQMLANSYVDRKRTEPDGEAIERLGYRYPKALLDRLRTVDLASPDAGTPRKPRGNTLVLSGNDQPQAERLAKALADRRWPSRHLAVDGPKIWSEEPYKGLIPAAALDALVAWAGEIAS